MDYDKLARAIYDITGPAGNIEKAYNCMTRLRLTVKDEHFSKDDLAKLPGVMGINKSGDEWQIIVGPGNKIIAAIGNKPELSVVKALGVDANDDGYIAVKDMPYGLTSKEGVFAAGDIVHKPQTVVLAMREGRKTAEGIDQYLKAKKVMAAVKA